ncbi:MAG: bifunctional diaminohydroxyphosphoribosylaminopyrimidine deaminase/5-amino-6-(5-phosphoribosylamino)uracil reductase RibD, partial [Legionella sp.]
CSDALIKAKVKKVVIPNLDPNPLVAGKGVEALRAVGIEVEVGVETEKAMQLNEIFFHYITHKRPYVILKWAMSLDGKTMTHVKDSRQISCLETQVHAHELRRQVDAILVGANTALRDNPKLTARLDKNNAHLEKQPLRIILANQNKLPLDLHVFTSQLPGKTLLVTTDASHDTWYKPIIGQSVELLVLPKNTRGQVDLTCLLDEIGKRSITSLLVEGGMTVQHDFMQEELVNKFHVYLANKIIGTLEKKQDPLQVSMEKLGTDFHFTGYFEEKKHV